MYRIDVKLQIKFKKMKFALFYIFISVRFTLKSGKNCVIDVTH
jgi:hypothetical protein